MLSVVLATPRTGSNTFVQELDADVWMPEHHPGYLRHYEYFNFGNHISSETQHHLCTKYYTVLRDHIDAKPQDNICVKLLVGQAPLHIINHLVARADCLYHTIRLDYVAQLKSFVAARKHQIWLDGRYHTSVDGVTQQLVHQCHSELTKQIQLHHDLYCKYGGSLVVLEHRKQASYPNRPEFVVMLDWPCFNTSGLFDIHNK